MWDYLVHFNLGDQFKLRWYLATWSHWNRMLKRLNPIETLHLVISLGKAEKAPRFHGTPFCTWPGMRLMLCLQCWGFMIGTSSVYKGQGKFLSHSQIYSRSIDYWIKGTAQRQCPLENRSILSSAPEYYTTASLTSREARVYRIRMLRLWCTRYNIRPLIKTKPKRERFIKRGEKTSD